MTERRPPLVILGLDVGDADAIERWAGEGHLPTIAGLMERGAWCRTGGPELVCEYGAGLTLFSGVSRRDHGHYYFRELLPGSYEIHQVHPPVDRAAPFWSQLRESGERVLLADVPDLRVVRGLPGVQLANWATHHGFRLPPEAEPPETLEIARRFLGPRVPVHSEPDSKLDDDLRLHRQLLESIGRTGGLYREFLSSDSFDLVTLFFSETHNATHQFWNYRPEGTGAHAETHPLRHGIRDAYEAVDAEMRRLLDLLPDESNVVVLSLFGMRDEYPVSTLIESFLQKLGYHVFHAPSEHGSRGRRSWDPVELARRIVPERVRYLISRRLSEGMQDRLLASRLRDATDWSQTTAFAIPALYTSFVRVNLRGREPHGIVAPGAEYEALLARLEADLALLVDAETGATAVRRVDRTMELFGGGPPEALPDLFVEWEPGPRMIETVHHPRATLVQRRPVFCQNSSEILSGFMAAAGPDIAPVGALGEVDLLDLAPTFLALLGHPTPGTMRGRPLASLLAE